MARARRGMAAAAAEGTGRRGPAAMLRSVGRRDLLKSLVLTSVAATSGHAFVARAFAISAKAAEGTDLAAGVHTVAAADFDLLFLSGATVLDLYHRHPHRTIDEIVPTDVQAQVHMTMRNIFEVLDSQGLGWNNVLKLVCYVKDIRELPTIRNTMMAYFDGWQPAMTAVQIEQLSSDIARFELEVVALVPKR